LGFFKRRTISFLSSVRGPMSPKTPYRSGGFAP
jgi:hypothetical protein